MGESHAKNRLSVRCGECRTGRGKYQQREAMAAVFRPQGIRDQQLLQHVQQLLQHLQGGGEGLAV